MIWSFRDRATEDIFHGCSSKAARQRLPMQLWRVAGRKLDAPDQGEVLEDLRVPPGSQLEKLKKDRKGQHSIRIND